MKHRADGQVDPGTVLTEAPAPTAHPSTTSKPTRKRSSRGRRRREPKGFWAREVVLIVVIALVVAALVRAFVAQAFFIPSGSMQNTLAIGDRILVEKVSTEVGSPHRGDVIVFKDPGGWLQSTPSSSSLPGRWIRDGLQFVGLAPANADQDLVKRVIGVGGDHVVCCNASGQITVNGVALNETSYIYPGDAPSTMKFDVTVPKGYLWVLGDHRSDSADSRFHQNDATGGMVPVGDVIGRAFVVVWPISHWSTLTRPATFSQPGLNATH